MDNNLKISIILPVYNAEKYLEQCLSSLLEQGMPKEQYEIICINDGSTDSSLSVIKGFADRYKNIVVVDQENAGVSAARNIGLEIAQGKYVWFVDADDWIAKDFLTNENVTRLFGEDSRTIPLILTKCINVYESDTVRYDDYHMVSDDLNLEEVHPFMTTSRGHFFARALIEKYHLRYDPNLTYGEDLLFMREFLDVIRFENEHGNNSRILQCGGCGVYLYRIHDSSAMGQLRIRIEKVAESILYRARWSLERYQRPDKPDWYKANYQEYINLNMQEYMLYYFPALNKPLWGHLIELKKEGLYPSPPRNWDGAEKKVLLKNFGNLFSSTACFIRCII